MVPLACSSCAQVQCHARPLARSVPPSKPSSPCQHECIVIPWYVRPPVIAHATHVDFPSTPSSRNASYLSRFTCPMCFSISLCQIACMQPRGLDVISGVYVIVSTSHRAQVCGHLQIIYPMLCTDSKTHSCTLFYWVVNCKTRNYTRLSFFFWSFWLTSYGTRVTVGISALLYGSHSDSCVKTERTIQRGSTVEWYGWAWYWLCGFEPSSNS